MFDIVGIISFLVCVSICHFNVSADETQCSKLEILLQSEIERLKLVVNLTRMKAMMEASQRDAESLVEQMDITGVEILFGCLKEISGARKYAQISVPSFAAEILYEVFSKPRTITSDYPKFVTFQIKLLDGDGHLKLDVTCSTESLVTMGASLKLLCDFGNK